MELLIKLTATYGLRRSEVLGLRWKAFNFEKNTLSIFHTVYEEKGKKGGITVIGNDIAKSKSSFRTLPLNELVKNLLLDYSKSMEAIFPLGIAICSQTVMAKL